jgi:hypothetical protein
MSERGQKHPGVGWVSAPDSCSRCAGRIECTRSKCWRRTSRMGLSVAQQEEKNEDDSNDDDEDAEEKEECWEDEEEIIVLSL